LKIRHIGQLRIVKLAENYTFLSRSYVKTRCRLLTKHKHNSNAWFNFTCYHPPRGNPGDTSSPSARGGELFEAVLSRAEGGGANRKCLLVVLVKYVTSRLTPDCVEETAYFQGESLEFIADWLEKNNLSKLKSVFEGTSIINC